MDKFRYTHCSEKATMAFQVSKSSHNSRTKQYFANPQIKIQENVTIYIEAYIETLTCISLMQL